MCLHMLWNHNCSSNWCLLSNTVIKLFHANTVEFTEFRCTNNIHFYSPLLNSRSVGNSSFLLNFISLENANGYKKNLSKENFIYKLRIRWLNDIEYGHVQCQMFKLHHLKHFTILPTQYWKKCKTAPNKSVIGAKMRPKQSL